MTLIAPEFYNTVTFFKLWSVLPYNNSNWDRGAVVQWSSKFDNCKCHLLSNGKKTVNSYSTREFSVEFSSIQVIVLFFELSVKKFKVRYISTCTVMELIIQILTLISSLLSNMNIKRMIDAFLFYIMYLFVII